MDSALIPNLSEYFRIDPSSMEDSQQIYSTVVDSAHSIQVISSSLVQLSEYGAKLASLHSEVCDKLSASICASPCNPIYQILHAISQSLLSHFQLIEQNLISPISNLVTNITTPLISSEAELRKSVIISNNAEEKYVSISSTTKDHIKEERKASMIGAYTKTSICYFDYMSRLNEAKIKLDHFMEDALVTFIQKQTYYIEDLLKTIYSSPNDLTPVIKAQTHRREEFLILQSENKSNRSLLQDLIPKYWENGDTMSSQNEIRGYLWKKCSWKWKKEFITVSQGVLSHDGKNVSLLLCSVRPDESAGRDHCFSIHTRKGPIVFQALTQWELNKWIDVIKANIAQESVPITLLSPLRSSAEIHDCCADCGSSVVTHLSLNWAVPLCSNCAEVHQKLPHEKVRALGVDEIPKMQFYLIKALGSTIVNTLLELNVSQKLDQKAPIDIRSRYISDKYIEKKFAAVFNEDDIISACKNQDLFAAYRFVVSGGMRKSRKLSFSPLHVAACCGNLLILNLICLNTDRIDPLDENGWSPLSYATYYDLFDVCRTLLSFGANPAASPKAHPYCIAKSMRSRKLIDLFTGFSWSATFDASVSFEPLHKDVTPGEFKLENYVDVPMESETSTPTKRLDKEKKTNSFASPPSPTNIDRRANSRRMSRAQSYKFVDVQDLIHE